MSKSIIVHDYLYFKEYFLSKVARTKPTGWVGGGLRVVLGETKYFTQPLPSRIYYLHHSRTCLPPSNKVHSHTHTHTCRWVGVGVVEFKMNSGMFSLFSVYFIGQLKSSG